MQLDPVLTNPNPQASLPVSQGKGAAKLLFVSGQAGIGDDGAIADKDDFDAQASRAFANLARALGAGGSGMDKVIKTTIFLTSMAHQSKLVELRRTWFTAPYPAETMVEVSSLHPPAAMIGIDAIAAAGDDRR